MPLLTVTEIVVLAVVLPEAPVMVTVDVPALAVLLAVSVRTLEVADEVGLNDAVTPLGSPVALNATLPVNPPVSATVMVSVPLAPCFTDTVDAEGLRVKPGDAPETVTANACVLLHELVFVYVAT